MGFESMRSGHARCPTYLVAGLLVMSFLLMCNWWSLSSQNYELLKEMDNMANQLSLCSDTKFTCSSKMNAAEAELISANSRYRRLEASNKEEVTSLKSEISELEKSLKNAKRDLDYCQTELDSLKKVDLSKQATLESMRVEKENLATQLSKAKEKVTDLELSLNVAKALASEKGKAEPGKVAAPPPKYTPQVVAKAESQDVVPDPSINDGPVNDGNHESNKDTETALENAANEVLDEQETGKRPPIKLNI